ncbi:P-loop containing nucleoside triphosphate hydrolase protein [Podospora australis]|uniref:P-loop containing nucleoside triphosphate hydrolase protein n=1 Tax=Podospora australis TaxID=1536484 RepID=A0AAN7AGL3_9PEZI|nr:P-loop containing nucleoside triphosphate hydrolase protein [Podospora australis]
MSAPVGEMPPKFGEYHVVYCSSGKYNNYHDVPRVFQGDSRFDHLRGKQGLPNMVAQFKTDPSLVFAVLHEYYCSCCGGPDYQRQVGYINGKTIADSPPAISTTKYVALNPDLMGTLHRLAKAHPERFKGWNLANMSSLSYEPHYTFYVHHSAFLELADASHLSAFEADSIKLVCNWFVENFKDDWDEADELFARGKTTAKHYRKLFLPDGLMIGNHSTDTPGIIKAYKVMPYPWHLPENAKGDRSAEVYRWEFNGTFNKYYNVESLVDVRTREGDIVGEKEEVDITSLTIFPVRFAKPGTYEKVVARGSKLWAYRKQKLIAYCEPDLDQNGEDTREGYAEHRYMVDYKMYKRMHPRKKIFEEQADDLGSEAMNKTEPPSDDFLTIMPPEVHAYDLSAKIWKLIRVDYITDVTWNKEAFRRLVVPPETKELIQAAVTAHGSNMTAARDIIAGKGQGLLILLHGGPGTGKTLTAESIAETQERPLYRITCGDIGSEPSEVEEYLQSVLAIGKAWGCVVLLDEADVFLEERTVVDQKHNAIVSVFLRHVEYYDGIMILTTNRVGTFDEAFKSRIHVAIRYKNLDEEQRVEIWRNFIQLLDKTKERIDTDDLKLNVNKLATHDLNGRQIRNVVTLARYLAKYRKQMLVYKHIQDALASVVKFDKYLLELKGHQDDEWARESRLR